jgi:hypothetical protein
MFQGISCNLNINFVDFAENLFEGDLLVMTDMIPKSV